jgi:hypothetical protein
MTFYEFVLQQDNVQNITIHQIKISNYNLHNPLTIKITCRLTITRRVPLKALCCSIYLYSVLWIIICIFSLVHCLSFFDLQPILWNMGASWSYGSWIHKYRCNECLSPQKLWVRISLMARCIRYNIMWYSLSVTCGRSVVKKDRQ